LHCRSTKQKSYDCMPKKGRKYCLTHPSLYQLLKQYKRRDIRAITQIRDADGITHTTFREIAASFVRHLAQKFGPIQVDLHAQNTVLQHLQPIDPQRYAAHLERPIKMDEFYRAIRAGARRKTPELDGICLEFYHLLEEDSGRPNTPPERCFSTTTSLPIRSMGSLFAYPRARGAIPLTPTVLSPK